MSAGRGKIAKYVKKISKQTNIKTAPTIILRVLRRSGVKGMCAVTQNT